MMGTRLFPGKVQNETATFDPDGHIDSCIWLRPATTVIQSTAIQQRFFGVHAR